ncbi:MAG TPA: DUF3987 domain-containing protein [Acidimicrobiales bacterium]|nr:DUF3987 domain-containing protein [Acidimicrobiales bacterium]
MIDALAGKKDDEPEERDTRLWVVESELARALRVIGREGSTLGSVVRMMWDGSKLEARSRAGGIVVADQYHAGIVGHITTEELRSVLTAIEIYGGTANRFLWVCAKRTQRLPDGGNIPDEVFRQYAEPLRRNLRDAYRLGRMQRTTAANLMWHGIYDSMGDDEPGGLLGAVTARAEPQVLRLSLVYALADGAKEIGIEHVGAAWALWRYCRGSAERIFGDTTGNQPADRLLKAIRKAGEAGLDSTQQMAVFSNHLKATQLASIRADLERRGLIKTKSHNTNGRSRVCSVAVSESSDA